MSPRLPGRVLPVAAYFCAAIQVVCAADYVGASALRRVPQSTV